MVKSIKLSQPVIVMAKFPKTASRGSTGVSIAREVPIHDVFKAINLITSKQQQHKSSRGQTVAVPVEDSNYDGIMDSSRLGDSRSRVKIIDHTSRKLAKIIVTQLEASNNRLHSRDGNVRVAPSMSMAASGEELLSWADRHISVASSSSSQDHTLHTSFERPVSLFSIRSTATEASALIGMDWQASYGHVPRTQTPSQFGKEVSSRDLYVFNNQVYGHPLDLVDSLGSLFGPWLQTRSSRTLDHTPRSPVQAKSVSGKSFSCKDRGVTDLCRVTGGMSFRLTGLVEDSYGSGPLRYQQDMENGPPPLPHSSKPRELGES